ncbi:hypothetical protein FQN50_002425 [Emmonsiellopsis sp. PD_5]|nr:hypothetical protein FQN50_002425 [Emmonsiellopsis sp. PD_5]
MLRNPTIYVLGRSAVNFAPQRAVLESLNPSCKIVFIEIELSLLSDVDTACKQILTSDKKVGYLYMSAGMLPLNGAEYTKESLELSFALSYYSRMRLLTNLLPLLSHSPHPRVLSVFRGGKENAMVDNDLGLEKSWSVLAVINQCATMTSLAFEYLAEKHSQITFMHAFPGVVQTTLITRITPLENSGIFWWILLAALRGAFPVVAALFGMSTEESGESHAYHLTSDSFGPGAWRIDSCSDKVTSPGVLAQYREREWPEKVWDHTLRVFKKI